MMRRIAVFALAAFSLGFVSGCGGGGTPSAGSGTGTVSFNVSSLTFASTNVGSSAGVQTLTLTNGSSAAISITSILVSGNNAADFSQTNTCGTLPVTLAMNASCSFSVNFTPTGTGTRLGTVSVVDNATNSPQVASLTGTAVAPVAPIATLSGNVLSFTSVTNGTTTAAQNITLTNTGTASLTGIAITITGTNASAFALPTSTSPCGTTLAASASCIISVNFTAPSSGSYTASVSIADNATGSPQTISLSGTGAAPLTDFSPSPGFLIFNNTAVSTSAGVQTLVFANTGAAADTITSIAIGGSNAGDFSQTNTCGSTLAVGASCNISVNFTPSGVGTRTAVVTVTDNSGGVAGSTNSASLSGTGVATSTPTLTISPSSLTFSTTTAQQVTITNSGASVVTVSSIALGGANASNFAATNTCGSSIAIGATCTASVTFAPTGPGTVTAALNITDNATGSPQSVSLSGTAAAVASLSPASLTLSEPTLSTTTPAQTVTLTNTGTATMTGIAVSLTGTSAARFAQTTTCGTTLAAGSNCTINVTFTPTASGTVTASLSVADSATGSPQTVALTGNGPGTTNLTQTFYVEPAAVYTSAYAFVDQATSTVDMTMYEDTDTTMTTHFINAGKAGVKVRIILDTNGEKSNNTAAYNALTGQTNVSVVWANKSFADTHEKSLIIDAAISGKAMAAIYTGNLSSQYYSTSRDFLIYENDPNDVAAMETTFNSDFSNGGGTTYTPSGYTPPTGDDLVWSPTNARTAITAVINNATTTLTLDEEEMSDTGIGNALAAAASRGVVVKLALTASTSSSTTSVLNTIKAAGGHIVTYPSSGSGLYIHAKAIVADFGLATETAFMGSENCSTNSLQNNRELGIVLTDSTSTNSKSIISSLNDVLLSDTACKSSPTAINTSSPSSCTAY